MRRPVRHAALAAAALGLLAGCSSQVSGNGHFASEPAPPGSPSAGSSVSGPTGPGAPSTGSLPPVTSTSPPSKTSSSAAARKPVKTVTVHGQHGTYVFQIWAVKQEKNCAAHAYGRPMVTFLRKHPCISMSQLIATTTVDGRAVGLAQNTIGFGGKVQQAYRTTNKFRTLVTRNGTGNLDDLLREGYRLPSGPKAVPSPDAFTALEQDNGCTVTDSWYLKGPTPTNAKPLEQMVVDSYLQI
jgi:hypothetical protein